MMRVHTLYGNWIWCTMGHFLAFDPLVWNSLGTLILRSVRFLVFVAVLTTWYIAYVYNAVCYVYVYAYCICLALVSTIVKSLFWIWIWNESLSIRWHNINVVAYHLKAKVTFVTVKFQYMLPLQPLLLTWLTFILAWISNHTPSRKHDGITYFFSYQTSIMHHLKFGNRQVI